MGAKCLIILSTTSLGVQGGSVQGVMRECAPRTMNGFLPTHSVNSMRNREHTGQQHFETPITRVKPCFVNPKVEDSTKKL